jgi:hypothetical protein
MSDSSVEDTDAPPPPPPPPPTRPREVEALQEAPERQDFYDRQDFHQHQGRPEVEALVDVPERDASDRQPDPEAPAAHEIDPRAATELDGEAGAWPEAEAAQHADTAPEPTSDAEHQPEFDRQAEIEWDGGPIDASTAETDDGRPQQEPEAEPERDSESSSGAELSLDANGQVDGEADAQPQAADSGQREQAERVEPDEDRHTGERLEEAERPTAAVQDPEPEARVGGDALIVGEELNASGDLGSGPPTGTEEVLGDRVSAPISLTAEREPAGGGDGGERSEDGHPDSGKGDDLPEDGPPDNGGADRGRQPPDGLPGGPPDDAPSGPADLPPRFPIDLLGQEPVDGEPGIDGAHVRLKHVGKDDAFLRSRIGTENISAASTLDEGLEAAEDRIQDVVNASEDDIADWLSRRAQGLGPARMAFGPVEFDEPVGRVMTRPPASQEQVPSSPASSLRVVLKESSQMANGFVVFTVTLRE